MNPNITRLKSRRAVYQVRITLMHIAPEIWRRVLIPSDMPLRRFHDVLQVSMGWQDCHLHQFIAGDFRYGVRDAELDPGMKSEAGVKLKTMLPKVGAKVLYEYDFGDAWLHELVLEEILPLPIAPLLPRGIAGERACPPEDCGGPPGYEHLRAVLNDATHPDHAAMRDRVGSDFDAEAFDLSVVNFRLGRLFAR